MSNLRAFNLTGAPVALAAGNNPVTLPASLAPPAKGEATSVTSELIGLSGGDYDLLQAQVDAGEVSYEWTGEPNYDTGNLVTVKNATSNVLRDFVWRTEAPADKLEGEGVYGTWEETYAAASAAAVLLGDVRLWYDALYSTDVTPITDYGMKIPAATLANGGVVSAIDGEITWDMSNIVQRSIFDGFGNNPLAVEPTVYFEDVNNGSANCYMDHAVFIEFGKGNILHDGLVHTPMRGNMGGFTEHTAFRNTVLAAKPIVAGIAAAGLFIFVIKEGYIGEDNVAPVVDGNGAFMFISNEGGSLTDLSFVNSGPTVIKIAGSGGLGPHQWDFPGIPGFGVDTTEYHGGQWMNMSPVVTANQEIPYNSVIPVDATGGDFVLDAKSALSVIGDPFTLVGEGTGGTVTVTPLGGETIDNGTIRPGERKTWAPDGLGHWRQTAGPNSIPPVSAAYTRDAVIVEDRTLLASASATALNNNNVLAALIADLTAAGLLS